MVEENQEISRVQEYIQKNLIDKDVEIDTEAVTESVIQAYEKNPNFVKLYSIYDHTAKIYGQPLVSLSDDVLKRNFKLDIIKDKQGLYYLEADKFSLHRIGYLHILNGVLIPHQYEVCSFKDLINTDNYKL